MSKLNIYSVNDTNFITSRHATKDEVFTMMEGTRFIKEIQCSYADILFTIGSETLVGGDGYKTDGEWVIETPAGIATIYNWKDGKNYCDEAGEEIENIQVWHIGGQSDAVARYITKLIFN